MPTKTDRILSYLPGTFRPAPQLSALRAYINAFGSELQLSENKLAEVMQAHWVDFADTGAEWIDDLARIAALYGLAPRPDEGVEEFRQHLKRYVRTFLEGTVTVQGILRITAEALALVIADRYEEMDAWWNRPDTDLISVDFDEADAASQVFGVKSANTSGKAARAAEILGTPDLSAGTDLSQAHKLYIVVDSGTPFEVDLASGAADPASVSLEHIIERINSAAGALLARPVGSRIVLASPTLGIDSRLEVREGPADAATAVMGLLPLSYHGSDPQAASLTGTVDLSAGVDLSETRYLRLLVDNSRLAEIDCAGSDPAHTFLDDIRSAINSALGIDVATHDGRYLSLSSPTSGANSTIAIQRPAAMDATAALFGAAAPLYTGQDAQPAALTGSPDLSEGVDLSRQPLLRLRVDDEPAITINCAGAIPASTSLDEIVAALNAGAGSEIARRDGRRLKLSSPTSGALSEIAVEPLPNDAAPLLLGIPPRLADGSAATVARLVGGMNLAGGVDLTARYLTEISLDGGPFHRIDLRQGAENRRAVRLPELVDRINTALESEAATDDGEHLVLRSLQPGGGSSIRIRPLRSERRRRFVTRAYIAGEAAQAVFGFNTAQASGDDASRAVVAGQPDLSRGVDLRGARFLRLVVDDRLEEFSCAGPRPRATLIEEAADKINQAFGETIALHDGKRLTLISPSAGAASRIAFETPISEDALPVLLGLPPGTTRGQNATAVSFLGVTDLSLGVDLPAQAAVKIGVDGAEAVQINLTGETPAHKSLSELVIAINLGLGTAAARHDGKRLAILSTKNGAASQLIFEVPEGSDATPAVFGIQAPRAYHGADPRPARVTGEPDLSGGKDLGLSRYLNISIDGGPTIEVDCASRAADPANTSLGDVVAAINSAFQAAVASEEADRLVLQSRQKGLSGRVSLAAHTRGDARPLLFGSVPDVTTGSPARPAIITGNVDLLAPANLAQRGLLKIAVDGGAPEEIDVAGLAPEMTSLGEITQAINQVFPGVASATEDQRLRLTSPTSGINSRLELLPLRYLELVEYPGKPRATQAVTLRNAERLVVDNPGAGNEYASLIFQAPQGAAGTALVSFTRGWYVRLLYPLRPGESARLWRTLEGGLQAELTGNDGIRQLLPGSAVRAGPLGAQAAIPFNGSWPIPGGGLQLNNPFTPDLVLVLPRQGWDVSISVREADPGNPVSPLALPEGVQEGDLVSLLGRLRSTESGWRLVDAQDAAIAHLRQGSGAPLQEHADAVIQVNGGYHHGEPPYVLVEQISRRYDVTLQGSRESGEVLEEAFSAVTIGEDPARPESLAWQMQFGAHPSRLARPIQRPEGEALLLERGRSTWIYLECDSSRFDQADFNQSAFAGGRCVEVGIFDVSHFALDAEAMDTVFAAGEPSQASGTDVKLEWIHHQPGAFEVNLPADLPPRFGGRFDQARFASQDGAPEVYPGAVTEPITDQDYMVANIEAKSALIRADVVASIPLGFSPIAMPFRKPRYLKGGDEFNHARMYLSEEGVDGYILLYAREPGPHGNQISVSARKVGPARYDVTITFEGGRFESARQIVLGPDLAALSTDLSKPAAVGVLQAKSAGVNAAVTRERTEER